MRKLLFLTILVSFSNYAKAETKALSFSKNSFFQSEVLEKGSLPTPLFNLKTKLENLIQPSFRTSVDQLPKLVYTFVPMGRSLQAPATDFRHPRVLFAYLPSSFTAGSRQDYHDLADRLYVSYSEVQNKLEIISWNNYQGRFNFEEFQNYLPNDNKSQRFVKEEQIITNGFTQRQLCLSCHQAGGPIYSDRPWAESSASFTMNAAEKSPIVQKIQSELASEFYLGLEIDFKNADGHRPLLGGSIHAVIKNAHASLLNARRLARRGCGGEFECQRVFLESVIRLAQLGYYEDAENNFFTAIPFREKLGRLIKSEKLPAHRFAFPSHTIKDRNPLEPASFNDPEINPAHIRPLIDGLIPNPNRDYSEMIASQMLFRGYEGLGFLFSNLIVFKGCSESHLTKAFQSDEFKRIVQDWNLNDHDGPVQDFVPLYTSVLRLLSKHCKTAATTRKPL